MGFFLTGSASMLAEGIHSVADTGNQGLLLLGGHQAERAPTPEHPFGFGRARYFWAFVVALVLFSLGGVFAIAEGVEKLRHPHELESIVVAIGILLFAIVLESLSLHTAVQESLPLRHGRSWWRFVRETKIPELPVVLLEDFGALTGLVLALTGVTLARITHNARFDALGSLAIGILLVAIAIVLAIEMRSLLLGEAASSSDQRAIEGAIVAGPHVRRLIHLRTQHIGPDHIVVAAKVEFDGSLAFDEVARAIDDTEVLIRAAVPHAKTIYLEPDVYQPR